MKLALCHDSLKIERLVGLLPPARLVAHGDGFLRKRKQTGALHIFRFLRCFVYFISLDKFFCTLHWQLTSWSLWSIGWGTRVVLIRGG